MSWNQRIHAREHIDDPRISFNVLTETYRQLSRVNKFTLGYWPMMRGLKYFLARYRGRREITILDIGCGNGELLRRIECFGRRAKVPLKLTGIDLSPAIVTAAQQMTNSADIAFIQGDALDHAEPYDLIISLLTTHHLTDDNIVKLLSKMTANARLGWLIVDLNRHRIAYYFIKFFLRIFPFNAVMRHDGPISVERSFRRRDWEHLIMRAGIDKDSIKITWYPNFRYGIRYEKLR